MRYFVSYSHRRGFGHAEVPCKGLIKGIEDIRTIAKEIEDEVKVKDVIILNFIPLDSIAVAEIKTVDLKAYNGPNGTTETNKEPSTKIIK